jgi:hypothetical protein
MGYAGRFLLRYGLDITINRTVPVYTKAVIKRSTKATYSTTARESLFEGLIESNVNLKSGEIISHSGNSYLVQTVQVERSGESEIYLAKANVITTLWRESETLDADFNKVKAWGQVTGAINIPGYCEIIARLQRQQNAGFIDNTIYVLQIPNTIQVKKMDRVTFDGEKYKVESIDPSGMEGVYKIQLSADTR